MVVGEPTASAPAARRVNKGEALLKTIADLKVEQKKMKAERKEVSKSLKAATRSRVRLKNKAKQLSTEDLLSLVFIRDEEKRTGAPRMMRSGKPPVLPGARVPPAAARRSLPVHRDRSSRKLHHSERLHAGRAPRLPLYIYVGCRLSHLWFSLDMTQILSARVSRSLAVGASDPGCAPQLAMSWPLSNRIRARHASCKTSACD